MTNTHSRPPLDGERVFADEQEGSGYGGEMGNGMKIRANVTIDSDELLDVLQDGLSHDEIIEFIKALDARAAEWSVTLKLGDYFEAQRKAYREEVKADRRDRREERARRKAAP